MTVCPDCRQHTLERLVLQFAWQCTDARCGRYVYERNLCLEEGFKNARTH